MVTLDRIFLRAFLGVNSICRHRLIGCLVCVYNETPTKSIPKDKGIRRETESIASIEIHAKETAQVSRGITDIPDGGARLIPMSAYIFGFEYLEAIGREDMDQVFRHLELGLGVIGIYIRFMYDNIVRPRGLEARFGFLAPNTVNSGLIVTRLDYVIAYVLGLFMAIKDTEKLFLLPYNTGNGGHWLLVGINL
ncbi:unnamed protein product [Vicia faba]|uniref:Uncharacterized protein n=1 Tax=Vicia faba TaxID=3906 RepID=A0AAV1AE10_VICFA|nr:unnamed protein product [Vicia faba]